LCGIFGNVSRGDIERTVFAAAGLCRVGGTVIWTRHQRPPDLTPQVRAWWAAAGFEELAFGQPEPAPRTGVGVAVRRDGAPATLPDAPLFRFGSAREDRDPSAPLPFARRKVTLRARNSRIPLLVWSPPAV
jgi:hypothetical protein